MSQNRYFNYEAPDASDSVNRQHLAVIPPGLYRGFDVKDSLSAGTSLVLAHTLTAFTEVDINGTLSGDKGVWISRQGVVIQEDDKVNITVTGNTAGNPRIDLIVGEHVFVETEGGSDAGYSVITGTAAVTPAPPNLTFPTKQVIIGQLYWPAVTTDVALATYTRAGSGMFGANDDYMFRSLAQQVDGTKGFKHILNVSATLTLNVGTHILAATNLSNAYTVPNVDSVYQSVLGLSLPVTSINGLNILFVYTLQKLEFDSNVFNVLSDSAGISGSIKVDAGETFQIWDARSLGGSLYLVKGGEANKSKPTKFFKQVLFNKGTASNIGSGNISLLERTGNYYELTNDFTTLPGTITISALSGNDSYASSVSSTKAGAVVFLRLVSSAGVGSWRLVTSPGSTPTTPYKAITSATALDLLLSDGAIITLLEDETTYRVLSITDSKYDIVKVVNDYLALTQTQEHVYTKTQALGWTDLPVSAYDAALNRLVLPNTGNSFSLTLPVGSNTITDFISDILLDRGGPSPVSAPQGLIINIKFNITPQPSGVASRFFVFTGSGTNIVSKLNDLYRTSANADKYTITANATQGETLTFVKTSSTWELIGAGAGALQELQQRVKAVEPITSFSSYVTTSFNAGSGDYNGAYLVALGPLRTVNLKLTKLADNTNPILTILPANFRPNASLQIYGTFMEVSGVTTDSKVYPVSLNTAGEVTLVGGTTALADMVVNRRYYLQMTYSLISPVV